MLGVHLLQTLTGNVGVNGGGRDIGMPQQHLYGAQVSAVVEQMGGKGMAQGMG
jgi:hypothetical protein